MSIQKFKRSRAAKQGRGRYPVEARSWATRHAERRIRDGASVASVATELGISDMTLRSWLYASTRERGGELCEVVVTEAAPAPARALSVTTAQGHVGTGLDLEGAAALLRSLG